MMIHGLIEGVTEMQLYQGGWQIITIDGLIEMISESEMCDVCKQERKTQGNGSLETKFDHGWILTETLQRFSVKEGEDSTNAKGIPDGSWLEIIQEEQFEIETFQSKNQTIMCSTDGKSHVS